MGCLRLYSITTRIKTIFFYSHVILSLCLRLYSITTRIKTTGGKEWHEFSLSETIFLTRISYAMTKLERVPLCSFG